MSTTVKAAIATVLILVSLIGGATLYVFGAKFTAHDYEVSVKSAFKSMESTWGMMEQSLKMQGFTVKNYGETFIKTLEANAKRYENDKGAMMKWVQEAKSQMSPEMHLKFATSIEKAYAKKEAKQATKIAIDEQYEKFLGNSFKGAIATSVWNYPTPAIKKIMDTVVSTKGAKTAMKTGIEAEATDPFAN